MYQREGAFVFWVFGLAALIGVILSLRKGTVWLWLRGTDVKFRRTHAPFGYWTLISIYFGFAVLFVWKGWHDWVWLPVKSN
jgi:hypothetical protein